MSNSAPATLDDILLALSAIRGLLEAQARPPAELLTREDMAAVLNVGISTFDRMKAARRIGPQPVECSGVKFLAAEVRAWVLTRDSRGELHDADSWPAVWAALQAQTRHKHR